MVHMSLEDVIHSFREYGPLGLFLAAFISNLIPGFPALYLTLVGAYGAFTHDIRGEILVILSAGVGAGLGKVVVFFTSSFLAGRSARIRSKREEYAWLLKQGRLGIFILVILVASLPLPDDVLYIPLGISGFSLLWFSLGVIIGKILLTLLVYYLGNAYWSLLEGAMGEGAVPLPLAIAGLVIGTVLLTAIIFLMDWKRIYEEYTRRGIVKAFIVFLEELVRVLTLRSLRRK